MSDVVNTTIVAARVGIFISNYTAYRFKKRVDDEASVRQWLMVKLDSAHQNALKVLDMSHSGSNDELSHIVKNMLNNIETFKNDSNLAVTGTRGTFFTSESAATAASIYQLIEYDAILLEKTEKISLALKSLSEGIINEKDVFLSLNEDTEWEKGILPAASEISSEILDIHNKFRERVKYIRGFGHK